MKYIKTYEAKNFRIEKSWLESVPYWRVNTKQPAYSIALKKLGMTPNDISEWSDMFKDEDFRNKHEKWIKWIYLYLNTTNNGIPYWYWSEQDDGDPAFFQGDIKVEDWEIDADKYNL